MDVLLGPRHFGNVNQTFDASFKLNKRTVIGDVGHAALVDGTQRELGLDGIPRIFLQLLHAKADAVGFLVDLDDLNLDGLADRHDFRRVVDAAPGHVGDVQKPVDTAQIHERTVFGDVLDHTVDGLAFGQVADHFGALFGTGFFQDRTARNNDVATAAVHFQNNERLLQAHKRASIAHRTHIDLRAGQERNSAAQIDCKATLDATEDGAFDALFFLVGLFQTIPGFLAAGLVTADRGFATGVLDTIQENLDLIANGDFGGFTGICEFFQIDAAFHLVADIDDGLSRFDRDDLAFDDRPFLGRVNFEAFFQKGFEFFHSCFSAHACSVPFHTFIRAMRLSPQVFGLVFVCSKVP